MNTITREVPSRSGGSASFTDEYRHQSSTVGSNPAAQLFQRISNLIPGFSEVPASQQGSISTPRGTFAQQQDEEERERRNSTTSITQPGSSQAPSGLWSGLGVPWVLKGVGNRSLELLTYFGLPQTETFLDDYNCALRKRVVLQGRMYIFDHYVCFSSFVFGFAKKVVIPLENVFSVRKKTHLRFPNSIKIELYNAQNVAEHYFFTSFLSREDAYQLITNCMAQSRAHIGADPDGGGLPHYHRPPGGMVTGSMPEGTHNPLQDLGPMGGGAESMPAGMSRMTGDDDDDDENDEGESVGDRVWGTLMPGPVPCAPGESKVILQAVLDGTPKELFDLLFADNSHYLEDFLESQGNRRINLTSWKRDSQLGHVRDIQFIAPIKGAFSNWGVPTTQCFQSHRFRQFDGHHLVFESSQTMTDIPYGDCFTVDLRWDVSPITPLTSNSSPAPGTSTAHAANKTPFAELSTKPCDQQDDLDEDEEEGGGVVPQMQLVISVRVPFSRKCLFRKVIESGSVKGIKDTYVILVNQLRTSLSQLERDKRPVQLGSPGAGGTLMQRLSSALPTASSKANLLNIGDQTSAARGTASTMRLIHAVKGIDGMRRSASFMSRGPPAQAEGKAAPSILGRAMMAWPSMRTLRNNSTVIRGFGASVVATVQDVGGVLYDVGGAVTEQVSPGYMFQILVVLLILGLQLVVLTMTLRAGSTNKPAAHHTTLPHHGAEHGDGGMAAFVAAGREMWSRRAALLQGELALLHQHVRYVEEHLAMAQENARQR